MDGKTVYMNFTVAPSLSDIETLATNALELLPEEFEEDMDKFTVHIEDFPDEATEEDQDLEDPYELPALYKGGGEISPGVEKKTADSDDVLTLYRRPILDLWADCGENLVGVLRRVMIEEIGRYFDYTDDEIDEMLARHYQGML